MRFSLPMNFIAIASVEIFLANSRDNIVANVKELQKTYFAKCQL